MTTPNILLELLHDIRKSSIVASSKIEGEGRAASTIDEGVIKRWMFSHSKWASYAKDVPPRRPGDVLIVDGSTVYPINIKTTFGTTDNATSKAGFLYALTDIEFDKIPAAISIAKFYEVVHARKADITGKDYWYMSFNKANMQSVCLRGSKQVTHWAESVNQANLLQINWKKEWAASGDTLPYDVAFDNIVGGLERSWIKYVRKLPKAVLAKI